MHFSNLISQALLLGAFVNAAPQPRATEEKRQAFDLVGAAVSVVEVVFDWMAKTEKKQVKAKPDEGDYNVRFQIEEKLSEVACVYGKKNKMISGPYLKNFLVPYCSGLVAQRQEPLRTNEYADALMSHSWIVKVPDNDVVEWKGDWLQIMVAWQQTPGYNGDATAMSQQLCESIFRESINSCTWEDNAYFITRGVAVDWNGEWSVMIKMNEIKDKQAQERFGDETVHPKELPPVSDAGSDEPIQDWPSK